MTRRTPKRTVQSRTARTSDAMPAMRVRPGRISPERTVPAGIQRPPYAMSPGALRSAIRPGDFKDRMRAASQAARAVLDEVGAAVAPGITTDQLDQIAHDGYIARGGYPSTLRYRGYPKSLCTSINEVICHGIPDDRALVEGDIVNVDVTIYLDGVHGDCSATFAVGEIDDHSAELVRVTHECLWRAIKTVRAGVAVNEIGRAIQTHAEAHEFSVVRTFVGHGIGHEFHTSPSVPHYFDPRLSETIVAGSTFTIEPMINMGGWQVGPIWPDGWTAPTLDGSRSAQFEHTLLATETGVEVLTALPDEVNQWIDSP